jgi:UDP-glucose 4-epimerase
MYRAAEGAGVRRVVYSSTGGALYGEPEQSPCTEEHPVRPLSPYGISKYVAEQYIEMYGRLHGLEYAILRYANVYGPRQDPFGEAGVVAIFTQRMVKGEEVVVFGDGTQERDFTFVDDIARGTIAALAPVGYRILNLGSDRPVSLNTVIALLEEMIGRKAIIESHPFQAVDVPATWADISVARGMGWSPQTTLEDGLRACVEWYRENREWAGSAVVR